MGHDMRHNVPHIYAVNFKHIWPPVVEKRVRDHGHVSSKTQLCVHRYIRGKNHSEHGIAITVRKRLVQKRSDTLTNKRRILFFRDSL